LLGPIPTSFPAILRSNPVSRRSSLNQTQYIFTRMPNPTNYIDELAWRGLLQQHTDGAREWLAKHSVSAYCGFDPTAPSLHVGSLVPIMGLVHLQRLGHRPIALVGGGTGLIGDPSGKKSERPMVSPEVVQQNADALRTQMERFLDFSGPRGAKMLNNAEWLTKIGLIEFLRDVGKHFSVNVMLGRESVKGRMEAGISYTEFSYMLLQAYDFLELNRREGVTFQIGGSDQWGNIVSGVELLRRAAGQEAHGATLTLVTNASGTKFGKSEAGAVWLDPNLTSPYQFYQFWINTDDRDVGRYLRMFTLLSQAEIRQLESELAERPEQRSAQRVLARDVTVRVHGSEAAQAAEEVSGLLFGKGDPARLSSAALEALAAEVPFAEVPKPDDESLDTLDLFTRALPAVISSRGAARRLLEQGGLSVNGVRLGPADKTVPMDRMLPGGYLLLRKGARDWALVRVGAASRREGAA
jgi:tyrosyl-tRNA synthetase